QVENVRSAGGGADGAVRRQHRRLHHVGPARRRHAHNRPAVAVAAAGHHRLLRLRRLRRNGGRPPPQRTLFSYRGLPAACRLPAPTGTAFEACARLVVIGVAVAMVWFGYRNFLLDLGSFRMPSMIPLGVYTIVVPVSGGLIGLFALEQLVNGWRRGFEAPEDRDAFAVSAE